MSTIRWFATAAVCGAILTSGPRSWAAPGDLDATFGGCGVVITDIGGGGKLEALALQPDGKIVAVGSHLLGPAGHGVPPMPDVVVLRYDADGTLDGGFGNGGMITTGAIGTYEDGRAVVVQPDGRIVVGGATTLVRYAADGTLDGTFGSGGIVSDVSANALVRQPDGKLVTAGVTGGGDDDFKIARYHDDGSLDATFGTGGVATTAIGSSFDRAFALVVQSDGKLVAAGYTVNVMNGTREFVLVRYEPDGDLDPTFGSGGIVVGPVSPTNDDLSALALQPDGKLVGAGSAFDFVVIRYEGDGSLDTGFGTGGIAATSFGGFSEARAVALQSTTIIAAGHNGNQVTLVAHDADGNLDPTFGTGGIVTTQVSTGALTNDLVVQSDGKLLVGGTTFPGKAFVARYFGTEGATGGPAGPCPTPSPTSTPPPTPTPTPTLEPICGATPIADCRKPTRPGKSKLSLKGGTPAKQALAWQWGSGAATNEIDFGYPTLTTDYALCVYDRSGGIPTVVLSAGIPSESVAGPCGSKPCWKVIAHGYKYLDKDATPDGIRSVLLRAGAEGKAKIIVKGRGANLAVPSLPLDQDAAVTVQLVNGRTGVCWDADFSAPATKSGPTDFKDTSD